MYMIITYAQAPPPPQRTQHNVNLSKATLSNVRASELASERARVSVPSFPSFHRSSSYVSSRRGALPKINNILHVVFHCTRLQAERITTSHSTYRFFQITYRSTVEQTLATMSCNKSIHNKNTQQFVRTRSVQCV